MSSRINAAIAVGSNLGDRGRTLKRAQSLLEKTQGIVLLRRSSWHETQAVGGPADQGPFLNGVFLVETTLDALALLGELQRIETSLGRDRSNEVPNGPRTMDLDLLWHGTTSCASDELTLPHAGLEERLFVLAPLAEILPDHPLPGCQCTVQERLEQLRTKSIS
ncbi:MAG: 2-amino-4-hydroxy-6-hydroxymethyldihydropteridine diphosphokinase [Planctomycetota bacterium]|nr:2-amino-4-hydroxy-6-hydroxymethyldihydropteridine diphosphokinase [Planctomycetota bacterium]